MALMDGTRAYAKLGKYADHRVKELSPMLQPYIDVTDKYGELMCYIVLTLGKVPPASKNDVLMRDLIADIFDFLYEARALIVKGKTEIAYPLARRAYESLSLLVACHIDEAIAKRWSAGKQISNSEIRHVLGKHPMGETESRVR